METPTRIWDNDACASRYIQYKFAFFHILGDYCTLHRMCGYHEALGVLKFPSCVFHVFIDQVKGMRYIVDAAGVSESIQYRQRG